MKRTQLTMFLLCTTFVLSIGSVYSIDVDGLMAYYTLNGDADDVSNNMNDGTVYGATATTGRLNDTNGAYNFDGSGDYIQIPDDNSLDVGTGDFSISFWINKNSHGHAGGYLTKRSGDEGWLIRENNNPHGDDILSYVEDSNSDAYTIYNLNLSTGVWYHIVVVYDRNGNAELFLDTVSQGTYTISGVSGSYDNSADLFIGSQNAGNYGIDAKLDEVSLWNRTLNSSEISDLYSSDEETCLFEGIGIPELLIVETLCQELP